ncbi:MAG: hypothetical protein IPK67_02980 [Planctomycetes bacterium]|nr:hypothetical protein [Planctomycetota bacterium]
MERLALAPPRLLASVTVLASLASAQSFQGLGDLAGGTFQSIAYGVSADGTTVVGSSVSAAGTEAVYWRNGVLTALADVAGGPVESGHQGGGIARLACTNAVSYCTPKTNALGCVPAISSSGVPSATAGAGFVVRSSPMRNAKPGLLLYTTAGPASAPFQGGTLCLASPIRRSVGLNSQGSPSGSDCTGVFSIDFNAFARGLLGGSPAAALSTPGTVVHSQFWGRDPGFPAPNNSQLSDGLRFTICD